MVKTGYDEEREDSFAYIISQQNVGNAIQVTKYTSKGRFYESDYPEVGTGESFIPLWGSGRQAIHDFRDGDIGMGIVNSGVAISDAFLLKPVIQGGIKGGFKALSKGNQAWSGGSQWYNPATNYSRFYHTSGFAGKNVPIHHSIFKQNLGLGKYVPGWIKNQMFNLKPIAGRVIRGKYYTGRQIHNAVHGKGALKFNLLEKAYYGTPNWVFQFSTSIGGRGINSIFN